MLELCPRFYFYFEVGPAENLKMVQGLATQFAWIIGIFHDGTFLYYLPHLPICLLVPSPLNIPKHLFGLHSSSVVQLHTYLATSTSSVRAYISIPGWPVQLQYHTSQSPGCLDRLSDPLGAYIYRRLQTGSGICHEFAPITIQNLSSCLFQLAVVGRCGCLLEYLVTCHGLSVAFMRAGWPRAFFLYNIGVTGGHDGKGEHGRTQWREGSPWGRITAR
jgi:hypothetical protein